MEFQQKKKKPPFFILFPLYTRKIIRSIINIFLSKYKKVSVTKWFYWEMSICGEWAKRIFPALFCEKPKKKREKKDHWARSWYNKRSGFPAMPFGFSLFDNTTTTVSVNFCGLLNEQSALAFRTSNDKPHRAVLIPGNSALRCAIMQCALCTSKWISFKSKAIWIYIRVRPAQGQWS